MQSKKLAALGAAVALSFGLAGPAVTSANAAPVAQAAAAHRPVVKEAHKQLHQALRAAQRKFVAAVHTAIVTFRKNTADERAALRAVLNDPAATDEQKAAARTQFRVDTKAERVARKAAIHDALAVRKAERKAAWDAYREAVKA